MFSDTSGRSGRSSWADERAYRWPGSENGKGDEMLALYVRVQVWRANAFSSEEGATAVEYALMLALIAMAIFAAVLFLGESTNSSFADSELVDGLS
jgi:Flp pilus assembly pilin Flp